MPSHPKHIVKLTDNERELLTQQCQSGDWPPRQVIRAKILLLADIDGPALLDEEISERLGCTVRTICNRRKQFAVTGSVEDTIFDKPRTGRPTLIDGAVDAHMTTIACSTPPDGRSQWTLRLIRDRMIALEVVETISHTTVRAGLKKKKSNPG